MSLSHIIVIVIGIILAIVGLGLILSAVGVNFLGIAFPAPWFIEAVVGVIFLGAGIYIIRGGSVVI